MTTHEPDPRVVIAALLAAGKVTREELGALGTALDDAMAEGAETVDQLVKAAARIWNLRRGYVALYVVRDDFAEHQRLFFANVDELHRHFAAHGRWNPRVDGFAWVSPERVPDYLAGNPPRPTATENARGSAP